VGCDVAMQFIIPFFFFFTRAYKKHGSELI